MLNKNDFFVSTESQVTSVCVSGVSGGEDEDCSDRAACSAPPAGGDSDQEIEWDTFILGNFSNLIS